MVKTIQLGVSPCPKGDIWGRLPRVDNLGWLVGVILISSSWSLEEPSYTVICLHFPKNLLLLYMCGESRRATNPWPGRLVWSSSYHSDSTTWSDEKCDSELLNFKFWSGSVLRRPFPQLHHLDLQVGQGLLSLLLNLLVRASCFWVQLQCGEWAFAWTTSTTGLRVILG